MTACEPRADTSHQSRDVCTGESRVNDYDSLALTTMRQGMSTATWTSGKMEECRVSPSPKVHSTARRLPSTAGCQQRATSQMWWRPLSGQAAGPNTARHTGAQS